MKKWNRHWKKKIVCLFVLTLLAGIPAQSRDSRLDAADILPQTGSRYIFPAGRTAEAEGEDLMRGRYASAQERLADMEAVASDAKATLYVDRRYAEFAIENKATKEVFFSNPYDFNLDAKATSDTKLMMQSILYLSYYDDLQLLHTMNSYTDCVAKNQFVVEDIAQGIAIHMQIGRVTEAMLLPDAVEATRFEEKVLPMLEKADAKKLTAYYPKISLNDPSISDGTKANYLERCPGLKEKDFYISRDLTDREKGILEALFLKTAYTFEDMQADMEESGYVSEETVNALFQMTLEVVLEDGDLVARLDTDSVSYDTEVYTLITFRFLEYFGAGRSPADGYVFVPDGSGALLHYNTNGRKTNLYTTNTIYGTDYALDVKYRYNSISEQVYYPVFGNKEADRAFLAIVEQGDSLADIISETGNILSSYETVFPEFRYHPYLLKNYEDATKIKGFYTYFTEKAYDGTYQVRYQMLSGADAGYVGMAKAYQRYLVEQGVLEKMEDTDPTLYLETLGEYEETSSMLGIPYTKSYTFTKFDQAEQMLRYFQDAGIGNIALRYRGYMNDGIYGTAPVKAGIESSLGGKKGFTALEKYAAANGIRLYPEVDFNIVRNDKAFDGYSTSKMPQTVAKEELWLTMPQEVTSLDWLQISFWSISTYYMEDYMDDFFKSYGELDMSGIAISNFGTMLYGEYSKKRFMSREEAKETVYRITDEHTQDLHVMVDGGNAFILPLVDDIVNVPVSNSNHTLEDESVPFMQLVLHGYKNYSGKTLNLSADQHEMFLKSIEYGSNLFFTLAFDNLGELKLTSYTYYFSIGYDAWKDKVIDYARRFYEAYSGMNHLEMTGHAKLADGVYKTTYENGTSFIVNYNKYDVEADGVTVKAEDFVKAGR